MPTPQEWPIPGHPSAPPPPQALQAAPHDDRGQWPEASSEQDDDRTRRVSGIDIERLKIPRVTYQLQMLDKAGRWHEWLPIQASGLNVGRARDSADFPALASMGVRHLRFSYEHRELVVEDLGSLNGTYRRVVEPVELSDGERFRVGGQVIEFTRAAPHEPVPPLRSEDGEEFCSEDVEPLAYLDLIRPDGRPGLRFPVTGLQGGMVLGRDGRGVGLALPRDPCISGHHAVVRHEGGRFFLEDLKSTNGTFIKLVGPTRLKSGDILLAGQVLFRVVDGRSGG
jgi:hypothetical protein